MSLLDTVLVHFAKVNIIIKHIVLGCDQNHC